jgi:two-component system response regulator AtoC
MADNKGVIGDKGVFSVRFPDIGQHRAITKIVKSQILERTACHVASELRDSRVGGVTRNSIVPNPDDEAFVNLISPSARPLERIIAEIAPTNIPVLIIGESGSGKEVIARRVHRLSRQGNKAFEKLTCARLSLKDLDQVLGGKKGVRIVKRLSGAGTAFLDEVSDLELACQPKLLLVVADGDEGSHPCLQARIISSSSRNIEDEIRNGRFREDLYYRLNGVCLRLPPLRHRKEDIPAFVDFFLNKYARQLGRPKPIFSAKTMGRFLDYPWPGNIRQLEYGVRNIVALGDERLALGDLESLGADPGSGSGAVPRFSLKEVSRAASHQVEREYILKALQRTHWNRKRAARELQISYKALLYKVKQIGMEDMAELSDPKGQDL